jgi:hypothetical protein
MALGVSRDIVSTAERMLADAYELVLSGWCQGAAAQDAEGRSIEPSSAFARRWSAPGALERVWRRASDEDGVVLEAYQRASVALSGTVRGVPQRWNDADDRRLDEVLDALAMAAERLRPWVTRPLEAGDDFIEETHRGDAPALSRRLAGL